MFAFFVKFCIFYFTKISRYRLKRDFAKKAKILTFFASKRNAKLSTKKNVRKKCEIIADDLLFSYETL